MCDSGCQGNIVEVWNLEGERINSIHVAGDHSGSMTGVLSFQVVSLLHHFRHFLLPHTPPPLPPRSSEDTLVILDFANPAPSGEAS